MAAAVTLVSIHLPHSTSGTPKQKFLKFGTENNLDLRMNQCDFGGHRLRLTQTVQLHISNVS